MDIRLVENKIGSGTRDVIIDGEDMGWIDVECNYNGAVTWYRDSDKIIMIVEHLDELFDLIANRITRERAAA